MFPKWSKFIEISKKKKRMSGYSYSFIILISICVLFTICTLVLHMHKIYKQMSYNFYLCLIFNVCICSAQAYNL